MKSLLKLVFFLIAYSLINGLPQNHKDQSQIHIKPDKPINYVPRDGHNAPPDRNRDNNLRNYFPFMSGYGDISILKQQLNSSESLSLDDLVKQRSSTISPPLSTSSLNLEQWHKKLEDHFGRTIEPQYVPFFEKLWIALENGTLDEKHFYRAMLKDENFKVPLEAHVTADIPVPEGFGQIYLYVKQLEYYRKNPTTAKLTTWPSDPIKRRAVSSFKRTFAPHYDNYYKWLYENVQDRSGAKRRVDFCNFTGLTDFDVSMLLKSTPFRIPPRHRPYFAVINEIERHISSTGHHYWRTTTPDMYHIHQVDKSYLGDHVRTSRKREDFWEERYQRYYPFTPEPQYEQFYRWFFKENHELNVNERMTAPYPKIIPFAVNPRVHDVTHKNTPYKIPPIYTVLFAFLDDAKLDNMTTRLSTLPTFNWDELTEPTLRTTTVLPSTRPTNTEYPLYTMPRERKRLIAEFFNVTIDDWYETFYEWFYRYQNDRKGIKRRLPAYLNLTDFDYSHELSKAKYPIPDKHREIWAYVHAIERQLGSTGHHYNPKNPYLWNNRFITNPKSSSIAPNDATMPSTSSTVKHFETSSKTTPSTVQHKTVKVEKPINLVSTHSAINDKLSETKKQTIKQDLSSSTLNPLTTLSQKLEDQLSSRGMLDHIHLDEKVINYFNKDIPPHQEKYYQWLYEHENEYNNNNTKKFSLAAEIYDQLDYTKLFRYTPFAIYPEHIYEFVGVREARRLLKAKSHPTTYKPNEPDPKAAMLDWFRFTIPPKYFEFYKWLFKLHLEKEEYAKIVQLSKKLGKPNHDKLLLHTPYPIPEVHLSYWAFIKQGFDEYVAQLRNSTASTSAYTATPEPPSRRRRRSIVDYDEFDLTSNKDINDLSANHQSKKSFVEQFFSTKILPQHVDFYEWLYGIKNDYDQAGKRQLAAMNLKDPNPIRWLANTPYPIPVNYRNYWAFVKDIDSRFHSTLFNPTTEPNTLSRVEFGEKVEKYFSSTIEPKYVSFYCWYYNVITDTLRAGRRLYAICEPENNDIAQKHLRKRLENTPFAIPSKLQMYYAYVNEIESRITIKKPSKLNRVHEDKHIDKLREYFTNEFDEKYDSFYRWYYELKNDDQFKYNLWKLNLQTEPYANEDSYTTPFPIPASYRAMYKHMNDLLQKNTPLNSKDTSPPVRVVRSTNTIVISSTSSCNVIKSKSEFATSTFTISNSKWASMRCPDTDSIHCTICEPSVKRAKREIEHSTSSEKHHSTASHRRRTSYKTPVTTDEQDFIEELENYFSTPIPNHFLHFYHWLYDVRHNPKGYHNREAWTELITHSDQMLDYKKILENTPFPIPYHQMEHYAFIRKIEEHIGSTDHYTKSYVRTSPLLTIPAANLNLSYFTAEPTTTPEPELDDSRSDIREQLENVMRISIEPKYVKFYRWMYDVDRNIEGMERRFNHSLNRFPTRGTLYNFDELLKDTPFPIPDTYTQYFAWMREYDRELSSTDHHRYWYGTRPHKKDRSTTTSTPTSTKSAKEKLEGYFMRTIPAIFQRYYEWLFETHLDNEGFLKRHEMASKINGTINYEKILTRTPFPIPIGEENHFAFIQEMERRLKSTDHHAKWYAQHSASTFSNFNNENTKSAECTSTTIDPKYEKFYQWLHEHSIKDDKRLADHFNQIKSHKSHYDFKKLLDETPFPIPPAYQEYFAFVRENERRVKYFSEQAAFRSERSEQAALKWSKPSFLKNLGSSSTTSTTTESSVNTQSISNTLTTASFDHENSSTTKLPHRPVRVTEQYIDSEYSDSEQETITQSTTAETESAQSIDPLSAALKQKLENHFGNKIDAKYIKYYEWLHKVQNDRIGFKKRFEAARNFNFTKQINLENELKDTPFPVPPNDEEYFAVVRRIERMMGSTDHHAEWYTKPNEIPTSSATNETRTTKLLDLLKSRYTREWAPFYEKFFQWLNEVREDTDGYRKRLNASKYRYGIRNTKNDKVSQKTPFPIPRNHQNYFAHVIELEKLIGSTKHHAKWYGWDNDTTVTESKQQILNKLQEFFTQTIQPKYLDYYNWRYKLYMGDITPTIKAFDSLILANMNFKRLFNNTPFALPEYGSAELWYAYHQQMQRLHEVTEPIKQMMRLERLVPKRTTVSTIDDEIQYDIDYPQTTKSLTTPKHFTIDPAELKKIQKVLSSTFEPHYQEYYKWLYENLRNEDAVQARFRALQDINLQDIIRDTFTPFPIHTKSAHYFLHVNKIEQFMKSTDHHYWLKRSTSSNTSPISLTPSSTPPIPFGSRSTTTSPDVESANDNDRSTSQSNGEIRPSLEHSISKEKKPESVPLSNRYKLMDSSERKNELNKYFRFTHEPKYGKFYEWLYHMRLEKDIPMLPRILWHFYKFDESASTPFPIPEDRKHEYAYIKYLEQHDFKTDLPHPTEPRKTKKPRRKSTTPQTTAYEEELQKAKSYFPFEWASQYNEFYTWFYAMIHKRSLRDKTCGKILDTMNFELLYLNNTKFPIPSQHYTEYAMMQYMDELPDKTIEEETDSQHWRDKEAAKKQFYPFRWQPDYDRFYIWLHRMINKHGQPESTDPEFKYAIDYDRVVQHSSFKIPVYQMHDYLYMKWLDDGKKGGYMNPPYITAPPSLLVRVDQLELEERAEDYFNLTENDPHIKYYVWMYEMLQKHENYNKTAETFFKNINYNEYVKRAPFAIPLGKHEEYARMKYYDDTFNQQLQNRDYATNSPQKFHTPVDENLLREAKSFFRFGWYPYYNEFYTWFYRKVKKHGIFKKTDTESFKNIDYINHLTVTPFLIPPEYMNDYAYMRQLDMDIESSFISTRAINEKQSVRTKRQVDSQPDRSRESFAQSSSSAKTTQLYHKWMKEQYEYHDPYYDKFYDWLIYREDLSPVSGGVTPRRVNPDVIVLETHSSTPFPIPANFTRYFRWFDDDHTKTSKKFDVAVTGDYMDYIENITKPPVEDLIKMYYSMDTHLPTLNTAYHDFYDWYIRKYFAQSHERPTVEGPIFISPFVPYVVKNDTPFVIPPKFTNYFKWFERWPKAGRSYRTPDYNFGLGSLPTTPSTWVYFDYNATTWWPPAEVREREFNEKLPKNFQLPFWKMLLNHKGTSHAPEYDDFYEWFYRKHFEATPSIEHYSIEEPKLFSIPTPMKYIPKNDTPWKIPWEHTDMMNWVDSEQLPRSTKEPDGTMLHPFYLTKFYGKDWMVYNYPTVKRYRTSPTLSKRKWTRTRSTPPLSQCCKSEVTKRSKRAAIPITSPQPESTPTTETTPYFLNPNATTKHYRKKRRSFKFELPRFGTTPKQTKYYATSPPNNFLGRNPPFYMERLEALRKDRDPKYDAFYDWFYKSYFPLFGATKPSKHRPYWIPFSFPYKLLNVTPYAIPPSLTSHLAWIDPKYIIMTTIPVNSVEDPFFPVDIVAYDEWIKKEHTSTQRTFRFSKKTDSPTTRLTGTTEIMKFTKPAGLKAFTEEQKLFPPDYVVDWKNTEDWDVSIDKNVRLPRFGTTPKQTKYYATFPPNNFLGRNPPFYMERLEALRKDRDPKYDAFYDWFYKSYFPLFGATKPSKHRPYWIPFSFPYKLLNVTPYAIPPSLTSHLAWIDPKYIIMTTIPVNSVEDPYFPVDIVAYDEWIKKEHTSTQRTFRFSKKTDSPTTRMTGTSRAYSFTKPKGLKAFTEEQKLFPPDYTVDWKWKEKNISFDYSLLESNMYDDSGDSEGSSGTQSENDEIVVRKKRSINTNEPPKREEFDPGPIVKTYPTCHLEDLDFVIRINPKQNETEFPQYRELYKHNKSALFQHYPYELPITTRPAKDITWKLKPITSTISPYLQSDELRDLKQWYYDNQSFPKVTKLMSFLEVINMSKLQARPDLPPETKARFVGHNELKMWLPEYWTTQTIPTRFRLMSELVAEAREIIAKYRRQHNITTPTTTTTTTTTTQDPLDPESRLMHNVRNCFPYSIEPQYEYFYRWLYLILHNIKGSMRRHNASLTLSTPVDYEDILLNTPFPIPLNLRYYFAYAYTLDDMMQSTAHYKFYTTKPGQPTYSRKIRTTLKTSTIPTTSFRTSTTSPIETTTESEDEIERKVSSWFSFTYHPMFRQFYRWLYRLQNNEEGLKRRHEASLTMKPVDYDDAMRKTPFPAPAFLEGYLAYAYHLDTLMRSTDHYKEFENMLWHYTLPTLPAEVLRKLNRTNSNVGESGTSVLSKIITSVSSSNNRVKRGINIRTNRSIADKYIENLKQRLEKRKGKSIVINDSREKDKFNHGHRNPPLTKTNSFVTPKKQNERSISNFYQSNPLNTSIVSAVLKSFSTLILPKKSSKFFIEDDSNFCHFNTRITPLSVHYSSQDDNNLPYCSASSPWFENRPNIRVKRDLLDKYIKYKIKSEAKKMIDELDPNLRCEIKEAARNLKNKINKNENLKEKLNTLIENGGLNKIFEDSGLKDTLKNSIDDKKKNNKRKREIVNFCESYVSSNFVSLQVSKSSQSFTSTENLSNIFAKNDLNFYHFNTRSTPSLILHSFQDDNNSPNCCAGLSWLDDKPRIRTKRGLIPTFIENRILKKLLEKKLGKKIVLTDGVKKELEIFEHRLKRESQLSKEYKNFKKQLIKYKVLEKELGNFGKIIKLSDGFKAEVILFGKKLHNNPRLKKEFVDLRDYLLENNTGLQQEYVHFINQITNQPESDNVRHTSEVNNTGQFKIEQNLSSIPSLSSSAKHTLVFTYSKYFEYFKNQTKNSPGIINYVVHKTINRIPPFENHTKFKCINETITKQNYTLIRDNNPFQEKGVLHRAKRGLKKVLKKLVRCLTLFMSIPLMPTDSAKVAFTVLFLANANRERKRRRRERIDEGTPVHRVKRSIQQVNGGNKETLRFINFQKEDSTEFSSTTSIPIQPAIRLTKNNDVVNPFENITIGDPIQKAEKSSEKNTARKFPRNAIKFCILEKVTNSRNDFQSNEINEFKQQIPVHRNKKGIAILLSFLAQEAIIRAVKKSIAHFEKWRQRKKAKTQLRNSPIFEPSKHSPKVDSNKFTIDHSTDKPQLEASQSNKINKNKTNLPVERSLHQTLNYKHAIFYLNSQIIVPSILSMYDKLYNDTNTKSRLNSTTSKYTIITKSNMPLKIIIPSLLDHNKKSLSSLTLFRFHQWLTYAKQKFHYYDDDVEYKYHELSNKTEIITFSKNHLFIKTKQYPNTIEIKFSIMETANSNENFDTTTCANQISITNYHCVSTTRTKRSVTEHDNSFDTRNDRPKSNETFIFSSNETGIFGANNADFGNMAGMDGAMGHYYKAIYEDNLQGEILRRKYLSQSTATTTTTTLSETHTVPQDQQSLKSLMDSYFSTTIHPKYFEAYKWHHAVRQDKKGHLKRLKTTSSVQVDYDQVLKTTPFSLPPHLRNLYAEIREHERAIGSTDHHIQRSTSATSHNSQTKPPQGTSSILETATIHSVPDTASTRDPWATESPPETTTLNFDQAVSQLKHHFSRYDTYLDKMNAAMSKRMSDLTLLYPTFSYPVNRKEISENQYTIPESETELKQQLDKYFSTTIEPKYYQAYKWYQAHKLDKQGRARRAKTPSTVNIDYEDVLKTTPFPLPPLLRHYYAEIREIERAIKSTDHHITAKKYDFTLPTFDLKGYTHELLKDILQAEKIFENIKNETKQLNLTGDQLRDAFKELFPGIQTRKFHKTPLPVSTPQTSNLTDQAYTIPKDQEHYKNLIDFFFSTTTNPKYFEAYKWYHKLKLDKQGYIRRHKVSHALQIDYDDVLKTTPFPIPPHLRHHYAEVREHERAIGSTDHHVLYTGSPVDAKTPIKATTPSKPPTPKKTTRFKITMPSFTTATDHLFSLFSYHFTDPNELFDSNSNPEDGGTRNFWELRNTFWRRLYHNHKSHVKFSPKYEPFYEWYFQWVWTPIYNYTTVGPFSISRKINYTTHKTSPFPIPPNYTKMFAWIDEKDAFKFTDIYCPTEPENMTYDPSVPYYMYVTNDRELMKSYFDFWFDPDPKYEEFYKWYYVQLHRAKDPFAPTFPHKRLPKAREEVPSISTPFPIPPSFRRFYAWAHDDSYNATRTTFLDTTHKLYRTLVSLYGFPTGTEDPWEIPLPYSHELTTRPPRNESTGRFKEPFFDSYPENMNLDNDNSIPFEWFREGRDWPYDEWGDSTYEKYNRTRKSKSKPRKKRHIEFMKPSILQMHRIRKREISPKQHRSSISRHRTTCEDDRKLLDNLEKNFKITIDPHYIEFFSWLHKLLNYEDGKVNQNLLNLVQSSLNSPKNSHILLTNTPFPVPDDFAKVFATLYGESLKKRNINTTFSLHSTTETSITLSSSDHHTSNDESPQAILRPPPTSDVLDYYKSLRKTFGKAPICNNSEEIHQVEQERQEFRVWLQLNEKMRPPITSIRENPTYSLFFHWLHNESPTSSKYKITRPLINTPFPVPEGYRKQYAERIGAEKDEIYKDLQELGIIDEIPESTTITTLDDFFTLPNTTADEYSDDVVKTSPRTRPTLDDMDRIEFVRGTDKSHFDSKEMIDRMNDLGLVDAKLDEKRTIFPTIAKFVTRQPFNFEALLKKESKPVDNKFFTRQAFDFDALIKKQSKAASRSTHNTFQNPNILPTLANITFDKNATGSMHTEKYQRSTYTFLAGVRDYYKSLRDTFGKAPIFRTSDEKREVEAERDEFRRRMEANKRYEEEKRHPLMDDVSQTEPNSSLKIPSEYLRAYLKYTGAHNDDIRRQLKELGYQDDIFTTTTPETKPGPFLLSSEDSEYDEDTPEPLPIMNLDVVEEPADARHLEIDSQTEKVDFNSREALERLRCMGMLAGMTTTTAKKYPHDIFSKQFVIEHEEKEFLDLGLKNPTTLHENSQTKRVRRAVEIILLSYESTTSTKRTTKQPTNSSRKYCKKRSPKSTTINTYDLMVSDVRFKEKHIEEYEKYMKKLGIYFLTTIEPHYADFYQWYYRRIREVTNFPLPPITYRSGTVSYPFFVPPHYAGMFSSLFHPLHLKEILTTQFFSHLFDYYDNHPNFKHQGRKIKNRMNFTWPYKKKLQLLEKKKLKSTTPTFD